MQILERKGHGYDIRRRSDSCLGWHCLSSATHFGIIFSIVVVVIVLSIVWMYYMGRARIMGSKTAPHNVPRRQRNRQLHRNPNGPTRPVSHLVQPAPALQYGVAQQTPVYFFSRPTIITIQPPGVINPHLYLPAPIVRPPEAPRPKPSDDVASEPPKEEETQQEKVRHSGNESPMRHPTWWQRLYRAFILPVGVASTLASSPSPEPLEPLEPLPPTHINTRHSTSCPNFDDHAVQAIDRKEARGSEQPLEEQDEISSMMCNLDTSSDSMLSIRSDVATVHSDDYEMPHREGNQSRSHKEIGTEPSS